MEQKTQRLKFKASEMRAIKAVSQKQMEKMKGARAWRNIDFIISLIFVVVLAFAIRTFIFEPVRVDGRSMVPTLQNNEHMFVEKISYLFRAPRRGEIVICYYPGYTKSCVKRVIGLPGEIIAVHNGVVYINGMPLDESAYWGGFVNGEMKATQIGEDEYFVMGDNRNNSKDSRHSAVGPIPIEKIKGRVGAVFFPLKNFRLFGQVGFGS